MIFVKNRPDSQSYVILILILSNTKRGKWLVVGRDSYIYFTLFIFKKRKYIYIRDENIFIILLTKTKSIDFFLSNCLRVGPSLIIIILEREKL